MDISGLSVHQPPAIINAAPTRATTATSVPAPPPAPGDEVQLSTSSTSPPPSFQSRNVTELKRLAERFTRVESGLGNLGGVLGKIASDTMAGVRFAAYGELYLAEQRIVEAREANWNPLDKLPVPQITRPFVLIPGWTTSPSNFQRLTDYLTRGGANGGPTVFVKMGKFYSLGSNGQLQPMAGTPSKSRVFEIVWSDTHQSPDKNLPEMRQNLDAISHATGYDKLDAEAYSMGGQDMRLYVDRGGDRLNRVMTLGTPNHGTRFGDMVLDVLNNHVTWAEKLGGVSEADRQSMEWLRSEPNNPHLQDLNSRWAQQQAKVPMLLVGTDCMPTAANDADGLAWGDGLVDSSSISMPDSHSLIVPTGMDHGQLNDSDTVAHIRATYFGWPLPPGTSSLFPASDSQLINNVPRP